MCQAGDVESTRGPLVLAAHGVQRAVLQGLQKHYAVVQLGSLALVEEIERLGAEQAAHASVLVTPGSNPMSQAALRALPNLRLIACTGSGYDGLDLSYAKERVIAVTNCPHVNAGSVAELAVGLLIASMRGLFTANCVLRSNGFVRPWPATLGLSGCRAGMYGLGAIGEKVARRLQALEMEVGYCARRVLAGVHYPHFDSLLSLAQWSDALIVCVPATRQTVGSIDAPVLSALGPRGYLVNVSRASIVDTGTLCDYLERQAIAGAALDVCDPEYLPRLLVLRNAVLTPHIGGSTTQAETLVCDLVLRNVAAHFAGAALPTPVNGACRADERAEEPEQ